MKRQKKWPKKRKKVDETLRLVTPKEEEKEDSENRFEKAWEAFQKKESLQEEIDSLRDTFGKDEEAASKHLVVQFLEGERDALNGSINQAFSIEALLEYTEAHQEDQKEFVRILLENHPEVLNDPRFLMLLASMSERDEDYSAAIGYVMAAIEESRDKEVYLRDTFTLKALFKLIELHLLSEEIGEAFQKFEEAFMLYQSLKEKFGDTTEAEALAGSLNRLIEAYQEAETKPAVSFPFVEVIEFVISQENADHFKVFALWLFGMNRQDVLYDFLKKEGAEKHFGNLLDDLIAKLQAAVTDEKVPGLQSPLIAFFENFLKEVRDDKERSKDGVLVAKIHLALGYLYLGDGQFKEAREVFEETLWYGEKGYLLLEDIPDENAAQELTQKALFGIGEVHYRSNQMKRAQKVWQRILQDDPSNAHVAYRAGLDLLARGKFEEALQLFENARRNADEKLEAKINEQVAIINEELAAPYRIEDPVIRRQQLLDRLIQLREVLFLDPDNTFVRDQYAALQIELAFDYLEEYLETDNPSNTLLEAAEDHFDLAFESSPNHPQKEEITQFLELIQSDSFQNEHRTILYQVLFGATKDEGDNLLSDLYLELASTEVNPDTKRTYLERSISLNQEQYEAHRALVQLLIESRDFEEAEAAIENATNVLNEAEEETSEILNEKNFFEQQKQTIQEAKLAPKALVAGVQLEEEVFSDELATDNALKRLEVIEQIFNRMTSGVSKEQETAVGFYRQERVRTYLDRLETLKNRLEEKDSGLFLDSLIAALDQALEGSDWSKAQALIEFLEAMPNAKAYQVKFQLGWIKIYLGLRDHLRAYQVSKAIKDHSQSDRIEVQLLFGNYWAQYPVSRDKKTAEAIEDERRKMKITALNYYAGTLRDYPLQYFSFSQLETILAEVKRLSAELYGNEAKTEVLKALAEASEKVKKLSDPEAISFYFSLLEDTEGLLDVADPELKKKARALFRKLVNRGLKQLEENEDYLKLFSIVFSAGEKDPGFVMKYSGNIFTNLKRIAEELEQYDLLFDMLDQFTQFSFAHFEEIKGLKEVYTEILPLFANVPEAIQPDITSRLEVIQGVIALQEGNGSKVKQIFEKAARRVKTKAKFREETGRELADFVAFARIYQFIAAGKLKKAEKVLAAQSFQIPQMDEKLKKQLGAAYLALGLRSSDPKKAKIALEKALEWDGTLHEARERLIQIHESADSLEFVSQLLDYGNTLMPDAESDSDFAEVRGILTRAFEKIEDIRERLEAADQNLQLKMATNLKERIQSALYSLAQKALGQSGDLASLEKAEALYSSIYPMLTKQRNQLKKSIQNKKNQFQRRATEVKRASQALANIVESPSYIWDTPASEVAQGMRLFRAGRYGEALAILLNANLKTDRKEEIGSEIQQLAKTQHQLELDFKPHEFQVFIVSAAKQFFKAEFDKETKAAVADNSFLRLVYLRSRIQAEMDAGFLTEEGASYLQQINRKRRTIRENINNGITKIEALLPESISDETKEEAPELQKTLQKVVTEKDGPRSSREGATLFDDPILPSETPVATIDAGDTDKVIPSDLKEVDFKSLGTIWAEDIEIKDPDTEGFLGEGLQEEARRQFKLSEGFSDPNRFKVLHGEAPGTQVLQKGEGSLDVEETLFNTALAILTGEHPGLAELAPEGDDPYQSELSNIQNDLRFIVMEGLDYSGHYGQFGGRLNSVYMPADVYRALGLVYENQRGALLLAMYLRHEYLSVKLRGEGLAPERIHRQISRFENPSLRQEMEEIFFGVSVIKSRIEPVLAKHIVSGATTAPQLFANEVERNSILAETLRQLDDRYQFDLARRNEIVKLVENLLGIDVIRSREGDVSSLPQGEGTVVDSLVTNYVAQKATSTENEIAILIDAAMFVNVSETEFESQAQSLLNFQADQVPGLRIIFYDAANLSGPKQDYLQGLQGRVQIMNEKAGVAYESVSQYQYVAFIADQADLKRREIDVLILENANASFIPVNPSDFGVATPRFQYEESELYAVSVLRLDVIVARYIELIQVSGTERIWSQDFDRIGLPITKFMAKSIQDTVREELEQLPLRIAA